MVHQYVEVGHLNNVFNGNVVYNLINLTNIFVKNVIFY